MSMACWAMDCGACVDALMMDGVLFVAPSDGIGKGEIVEEREPRHARGR